MATELTLEACDQLDGRQFRIAVRRLADSLTYGTDSSPFHGAGIEYAESRPYQPGDPVRSIDWRVTARTAKPYVKEYEAPKRMPIHLVLDTSASMCVGSQRLTKYALAVQLVGGLSLAATARMSPVAVTCCGDRGGRFGPTLSRADVFEWLHRLRHFSFGEGTRLAEAVQDLAQLARPRSLIIVLSDLHDPQAVPVLKRAVQVHDCVVLEVRDPAERGRLRAGFVRAEEAETGRAFVTHGRGRWLDWGATRRGLRRAGVDHFRIVTGTPFIAGLRAFLRRRDYLGRGTR